MVRACLQARHAATAERMARGLEARYDTSKERLVGAFEVRGLSFTEPGFRSCAFISASPDAPPGGVVEQAALDNRTWLHELFFDLAQQAGATAAKSLAHRLAAAPARVPLDPALRRRRDQCLAGPRTPAPRQRPAP
ncbi:hypothetical protein [Streptomyces sp. NPDC096311]|uniref:hypothetical protein n=1 Tax=Streptomyces sp. NPDC096311 TaxID=3366083 RepID=UPI0037F5644A